MKRFVSFILSCFLVITGVGAQTTGDTIHVSHYAIHLTDINTEEQTLAGFTEATVVSKHNNLNAFSLELKALTVDSVWTDNGSCTFKQSDELVRVLLQQPLNENDEVVVKIWYHGTPFHEAWGGFHWNGDYAFNLGVGFVSIPHNLGKTWFPCVDDFTDRATYDFFITVDSDKKAACGGVLQSVTNDGDGSSTWHWKLNHEIPTYLASVAVGEYALVQDEYIGVEDTVPITFFVHPADSSKVKGSFVNLKNILRFYETKFGPYPFGRVGYTGTSIGAMEHVGNISYPNFAINGNTNYESLYSHELSHMWFGDKVTCSRAEEMWLNEGWASFCEMYYLEGLGEHNLFLEQMHQRNVKVLKSTHVTDHGYWALAGVPQEYTYGSTSYDKGAVVVYTLRNYLGDSLFSKAMTAYLQQYAYRSAGSRDLQNFLTDYTGIDMKPFFDAWVFTPGTPHFSIDSSRTTATGDNFRVDIYLHQRYRAADYLADNNILEIGFLKDDFSVVTDTVHFSGKLGHSVKTIGFKPLAVMVDPFEKTADATVDAIHVFKAPENYSFPDTYFQLFVDELNDSAFVRVTHNQVAPDTLKYPIKGLRISPGRYWLVEGFVPEGTRSRGQFYYSNSNYLDGDMNLTDNDSIMILYRSNAADEWHYVPQYIFGGPTIGYIYVEDIRPGEYVLAALQRDHLGIMQKQVNDFKIYPNPVRGKLNFSFKDKANYNINIVDSSGRIVEDFIFSGKKTTIRLKSSSPGIFVVSVTKNGKYFASKKVVFSK